MSLLARWIQRILTFLIAAATLWIIVTQVYDRIEQRLPVFAAVLLTYVLAAYVILPLIIHASVALLRRNRIPRVTRAADGLPADPVNVILIGSQEQLRSAFAAAGWQVADVLTLRSAAKMVVSFVLNRSYPTAPFSALFLFGRRQDTGFQEDIGDSPRKRHHVRFWAADTDPESGIGDLAYWTRKRRIDPTTSHIWIGAGTTDTGFGLQSMTWQLSHRVDRHADSEREHIAATLRAVNCITDERYIDAGEPVGTHFITDGRIFRARLIPQSARSVPGREGVTTARPEPRT
ncbi:LssY C-terminal domain-containing protein [Bradyrhizobium sp. LHD-71]|uniref:LssY C-terminal domain-containing protein n=1 Tax=Bradyrhizobium sp. LHD-71 TaxID=3072141 RepID=UPI0028108E1B|nr:LssY C-terminal domain-containing protein [Bradyrhizobium sp. LHD-71]MDQ8732094.1 LssY C-terminal domain-containing protein [Bradyrhizobium sp. LHD-71]